MSDPDLTGDVVGRVVFAMPVISPGRSAPLEDAR